MVLNENGYGSRMRTYILDFIVLVDDRQGADDPLHLIVESKESNHGDLYWVPGVNNLGQYGR